MLVNQNYFYIIPALLAEGGKPQKALLYGLVTSLANKSGVCYASNNYLAKKLNRKDHSMFRIYLTELEKEGWITIENRNSAKRKISIDQRKKTNANPREKPRVNPRENPHRVV